MRRRYRRDHTGWFSAHWLRRIVRGGSDLDYYLSALNSHFAKRRQRAAGILGAMGSPEAVSPLINHVSDPKSRVRESTVKALGELRDSRSLDPLLNLLSTPEWGDLSIVIETLINFGPAADNRLQLLLTNSPPTTQFWAARICHQMGIDIWEMIDLAATKPFGFVPFYPGPGPGGTCIPVDPFYVAWKAREFKYHANFIELAGDVLDEIPGFVLQRLYDMLNESGKAIEHSKILFTGRSLQEGYSGNQRRGGP